MRLTLASSGLLLLTAGMAVAQSPPPGPGLPPRLPVASCPQADSLLGEASKDALKAEIHGRLGPGAAYSLTTGPGRGMDAQTLQFTDGFLMSGPVPGGYVTAWFPSGLLEKSREQAEPMYLVVEDTLSLPLSTPAPPGLSGVLPPAMPFTAMMRSGDLRLLLAARKAKLTFLGRSVNIRKSTIAEAEAAVRVIVCHIASIPAVD